MAMGAATGWGSDEDWRRGEWSAGEIGPVR